MDRNEQQKTVSSLSHTDHVFPIVLIVFLSSVQRKQVIYLRFTCDWMFELLAMACNKSFNMWNILLAILSYLSQY